MTKAYQQLTYEQRCQISALKKRGCSQKREIAEIIDTSQSTVSRELARNSGQKGYRYKQAQEKSTQRRAESVKPTKMTPKMIGLVESKLREEWSPEQISGWLLYERKELLSYETIYLHIWTDNMVIYTPTFAVKERNTINVAMENQREAK